MVIETSSIAFTDPLKIFVSFSSTKPAGSRWIVAVVICHQPLLTHFCRRNKATDPQYDRDDQQLHHRQRGHWPHAALLRNLDHGRADYLRPRRIQKQRDRIFFEKRNEDQQVGG